MNTSNPEYWRRKLSAFLHDSPDKVINLVDHEGRARSLAQAEGFLLSEKARKEADLAASAADRLPWPKPEFCRSEFDATDKALRHPLGKAAIEFAKGFTSEQAAMEVSQSSRPRIADEDPRAAFITAWRFWQNWASSADERFACLPAETRLPDHTIWNHLSVTSALQGCFGGGLKAWVEARQARKQPPPPPDRPAFLVFTIGPVQEFIAAARNTRDLWSGSYLLSYLAGTALAKIALDFGPDHVLFPNLNNQPILDLLLKRDLWDSVRTASGEELWQAFGYYDDRGKERLLTPSLPNRFLAILPEKMAEHPEWQGTDASGRSYAARYAAELEKTIRNRLREIADSVFEHCKRLGTAFPSDRFSRQIRRLLEIHWQVLPWPESVEEAMTAAQLIPGEDGKHPLDSTRAILAMLDRMPAAHRDQRYFRDGNVGIEGNAGPLAQISNGWSSLYALAAWRLDAVKATRAFRAWSEGGWQVSREQNKDSLNGKEEACLAIPYDEDAAKELSRRLADRNKNAFKPGDVLGASTLVKRLWHLTWLSKQHHFVPAEGDFAMPNTRSIADHRPFADSVDDERGSEKESKYFAVLALDGDEMGQWISGAKCPELSGQVSNEARAYFEKYGNKGFLESRRPLSPSFHLQFSELLGNFGIYCVRRIVEAFDGRLIYAGGDDVLAMLPADTAVPCARALRAAFRGEESLRDLAKGLVNRTSKERENWRSNRETPLFDVEQVGFVKLTEDATPREHGSKAGLLDEPVKFPFLVPGPATDCSVGIAIAHFKSPLQDVVGEAQRAEKRAKRKVEAGGLDRRAVAVTLMKRSGETIEWGCRWESRGLEAYSAMLDALKSGVVSAKFPHRIVELVQGYLIGELGKLGSTIPVEGFELVVGEILKRDIDTAAERQRGPNYSSGKVAEIQGHLISYLDGLDGASRKIKDLIGLCQTVAFIERNPSERKPSVTASEIRGLQSPNEPAKRQFVS